MNFFKVFILFSFFNNTLQAAEPYLDILTQINSGKIIQSPQIKCQENLVYGFLKTSDQSSHNHKLNQCAVDLCGKPGDNPSVWVLDSNFSSTISKSAKLKADALTPLLKKMFQEATKDQLKNATKMKLFSENFVTKLNSMNHASKNDLAKKFFEPFFSISVDNKLPLKERIIVTPKIPDGASSDFLLALNSFTKNMKKEMLENPYFTEFQSAVREEDLISIARGRLDGSSTAFKTNIGELELKKLNDSLATIPFDRMAYIQFNNKMSELSEKAKQSEALLCDVKECERIFVDFFSSTKVKNQISEFERVLKTPKTIERSIAKCKAQVIAADLKSTSEAKAFEQFNKARSKIIERFVPLFSPHSQSLMRDYLITKLSGSHRDIKKGNTRRDPYLSLRQEIQEHLRFQNSLIPIDREDFYAEKIIQTSNNPELIYPFEGVNPCSKMNSNAWDSFLPTHTAQDRFKEDEKRYAKTYAPHDAVFVSDFSCQHTQYGMHNVSHEIGHALNSLFLNTELSPESKKKYDEMRTCAADLYPKSRKSMVFYSAPGDKVTTEEDMADLIAFQAFKDDKKIYSCALLKPSNVFSGYQDLKFFDDDSDNVHTTSLMRSLQEAFQKDLTIPQSCLESIEKEASHFRFKKCI